MQSVTCRHLRTSNNKHHVELVPSVSQTQFILPLLSADSEGLAFSRDVVFHVSLKKL